MPYPRRIHELLDLTATLPFFSLVSFLSPVFTPSLPLFPPSVSCFARLSAANDWPRLPSRRASKRVRGGGRSPRLRPFFRHDHPLQLPSRASQLVRDNTVHILRTGLISSCFFSLLDRTVICRVVAVAKLFAIDRPLVDASPLSSRKEKKKKKASGVLE